jgi:hypothetical protein
VQQVHEAPVALGGHGIVGLAAVRRDDEPRRAARRDAVGDGGGRNAQRGVMEQKTNSLARADAIAHLLGEAGALS